jgi:hypothetical protein
MQHTPKSVAFQDLMTGKTRRAKLDREGRFIAHLPAGSYQVRCGRLRRTLAVTSGSQHEIELDLDRYIDFTVALVKADPKHARLQISALGRGRHTFELRLFNARLLSSPPELELEEDFPYTAIVELAIEDPHTPWLALLAPDGERSWAAEILR